MTWHDAPEPGPGMFPPAGTPDDPGRIEPVALFDARHLDDAADAAGDHGPCAGCGAPLTEAEARAGELTDERTCTRCRRIGARAARLDPDPSAVTWRPVHPGRPNLQRRR